MTRNRIDSLHLKVGQPFGYWFDDGDDWWHEVNVQAVGDKVPSGKYPKATTRVSSAMQ